MPAINSPALVVVCGTVAAAPRPERRIGPSGVGPKVPITWVAPIGVIAEAAGALGHVGGGPEFALEIPAAAFESRQQLRSLIVRAREVAPSLTTAAVRREITVEHRALLVNEGIRLVLVDRLATAARGDRRPAPPGWRCRNTSWGLWEIEKTPSRQPGLLTRLGLGRNPRLERGGLVVLATDGIDRRGSVHPRLDRLAAWVLRHQERKRVVAVPLSALAGLLAGGEPPPLTGSVLRAA